MVVNVRFVATNVSGYVLPKAAGLEMLKVHLLLLQQQHITYLCSHSTGLGGICALLPKDGACCRPLSAPH